MWEEIKEPDNQPCINMLASRSGRPVGIFALLDEQATI